MTRRGIRPMARHTWAAPHNAAVRHAFKNAIVGLPSVCGRGSFPGHRSDFNELPYCKWCTDKAQPPDAPNTGGMHAKGNPWAVEGKWIKPTSRSPRGYRE